MFPSSNKIAVDECDVIEEKEEVGFFFIKDAVVTIPEGASCSSKKNDYVNDEWIDITIKEEDDDDKGNIEEGIIGEAKFDFNYNRKRADPGDSRICPRCNVVLQKDKEGHLEYTTTKQGFFNGLIKDSKRCDWCIHVDECSSNSIGSNRCETVRKKDKKQRKNNVKKQRSDAALLLGAILQCKDADFLRIEKFQILFCGEDSSSNNLDKRDDQKLKYGNESAIRDQKQISEQFMQTDLSTSKQWVEVRCAIVITISLPLLESVSKSLVQKIAEKDEKMMDIQYDDFLITQGQGFAPYGQLAFAVIRSDWSWLGTTMSHLKHINEKIKSQSKLHEMMKLNQCSSTSVFPPSLSLEDLYCRIRGASSTHQTYSFSNFTLKKESTADNEQAQVQEFLSLPEDVLISNVAPYLRAKSLHQLRMTCKYLNHILRGVVPGMKLKLYPHQVRSLQWMRQREMKSVNDDDALQTGCDNSVYSDSTLCGDLFRSVSAGSIVCVTPRRKNEGKKRPFWHINSWTGGCSIHSRNERMRTVARCRNVARGGLLCDDPGMGKTITFLSCILQTFGQSTERRNNEFQKRQVTDDLIVDSYWRENLVRCTRCDALIPICMQIRKFDTTQCFQYPVQNYLSPEEFQHYCSIIKNPICLEDIITKVEKDEYSESITDFANDIRKIYENAKRVHKNNEDIHKKAVESLKQFESIYEEFRQQQLAAAIAAQKRSRLSLSTLVSESRKALLLNTLLASKGTLLVVPHTLTDHWEEQIKLHVDFSACCSDKAPLIFRRRGTKAIMRGTKVKEVSSKLHVHHYCNVEKSHYPFLFIDECNEKMPSEKFLAQFYVVLTTTKRLTLEWKHGSFEEELRKSKGNSSSYRSFNYDMFNEHNRCSPCPLLKVHWLRLVVDEGHTMGKKGSPTNAIQFASWIQADYRWAMTGTPTPQKKNCGADNLFGLMKFLKHDYFLTPHFGEERSKSFSTALKKGHVAAFCRLQHLLNLFMVRHTKQDVELHKPIFAMTKTDLSKSETRAYDTLVTAVQMNLITTSMKGKTSGLQDSILHARQSKHAHTALRNIRLACSGGTSIVPTLTTKNWDLTIDMMRTKHNVDEKKISKVEHFLTRMTTEQLSVCGCCGVELQTLFLLPCACQICTECMNPSKNQCVSCNNEFDIDDFQLLQPGLDYVWKWNLVEAKKNREARQLMDQSIRESLNNRNQRPALENNDNSQNHNQIENNNVRAQQIQQHVQTRRRRNEPHVCTYPNTYIDGRCKFCFEVHACNFMRQRVCPVCHCVAEECPKEESKAYHITEKLLMLWSQYENRGIDVITGKEKRPLKVLIFTQFQQVSNLVGDRLIRRFGTACIAEYWGVTRNNELERFRSMPDCFCMLLNRDGSHGLNLSFVTHIFFLDEILDKSLESQVVSRAYRMGATENVFVEQLVSRHSIEELIVLMNRREGKNHDMFYANSNDFNEFKSEYYDGKTSIVNNEGDLKADSIGKVHYLLRNMKLIRPNHMSYCKRNVKNATNNRRNKKIRFADEQIVSIDKVATKSTEANEIERQSILFKKRRVEFQEVIHGSSTKETEIHQTWHPT